MKTDFIKIYEELSILNESSWIKELKNNYDKKNSDIFNFQSFNKFKDSFIDLSNVDKEFLRPYYEFLEDKFIEYGQSRYPKPEVCQNIDFSDLEGHHILPSKNKPNNNISNLIALSSSDHKEAHKKLIDCLLDMWLNFIQASTDLKNINNSDMNTIIDNISKKIEISVDDTSIGDIKKDAKKEFLDRLEDILSTKINKYRITWIDPDKPTTEVFSRRGVMKAIELNYMGKMKKLNLQAITDWIDGDSSTLKNYGIQKIERI